MSEPVFHPIDVILHKRDGLELSTDEIRQFIQSLVKSGEKTSGPTISDAIPTPRSAASSWPSSSAASSPRELADSHRRHALLRRDLRRHALHTFTVDKHSTGGVGDKTSLLIAPSSPPPASPTPAGIPSICVPMISGRSLGHTGGTLDKLETIPGFNTQLSLVAHARRPAASAAPPSSARRPRLVPADRILYALRDHTGTVESPFLITASIMSKKLAEDLNALVLDVKVGSGAFMPTYEKSKLLAKLMVQTGELAGTRTVALLTTMDEPLGRFSGNWVEVWECVDIMKQHTPPDVRRPHRSSPTSSPAGCSTSPATPQHPKTEPSSPTKSSAVRRRLQSVAQHRRAQGGDTTIFEDPAAFHKPRATRSPHSRTRRLPRRHGLQASRLGRPTPRRRPRQTGRSRQRPRGHRIARQTWRRSLKPASPSSPSSAKTKPSSTSLFRC